MVIDENLRGDDFLPPWGVINVAVGRISSARVIILANPGSASKTGAKAGESVISRVPAFAEMTSESSHHEAAKA